MNKFIVWYKTSDQRFRVCYSDTHILCTLDNISSRTSNQFELISKIKASDEVLINFCEAIVVYRNEILSTKKLLKPFDYFDNSLTLDAGSIYYRTHSNNIINFMKRFIKREYLQFEAITIFEESMFVKCNRGGLQQCTPGVYDCWAYDMKMFYPSIMAHKDYYIPGKEGVREQILEIPKIFKFGIYNIKITSSDANFQKVFSFSKHSHYTHYSLNFVLAYNSKSGNTVAMELLSKEALLYSEESLVSGFKIFNCWYNRLLELKTEFPKNLLVKKLSSTCWGELQQHQMISKTEEEVIKEKLSISFDDYSKDYIIDDIIVKDSGDVYKLIPTKNLYKYNLRMKAFITDYARVFMANIALSDIDDVIRIQTDGIVYSQPKKFKNQNFVPELDKTGTFEWFHVNKWKKIDH